MITSRFRCWLGPVLTVGLALGPVAGCHTSHTSTVSHADVQAQLAAAQTESPSGVSKKVSFALLDDYDKGQDLHQIEADFNQMHELGISTMRCSFGWDDYEPEAGQYDLAWLKQFVALAQQHQITIRPYIDYTPKWAGKPGKDNEDWNNPPANQQQWHDFTYQLVSALREHPNVPSFEIYNEENAPFWWDGTIQQYMETLKTASEAIRAANPRAQVMLGGFVFPDDQWLEPIVSAGYSRYYDITPFHAYPETWSPPGVTVENYLGRQYHDFFVPQNNTMGDAKPIWINEMGFATSPGKTEQQQANWYARAVSTFLADPSIVHLGFFELRDNRQDKPVLGENENYYLGLTYADGRKKLAFHTVKMLMTLLNVGELTTADHEVAVVVTAGQEGELYRHLFKRRDGSQVLFIWDKTQSPTVQISLTTRGTRATRYLLDGKTMGFAGYDGKSLSRVSLQPGEVAIFRIEP
jgi:polysaccharide biosynthesis protein PslG